MATQDATYLNQVGFAPEIAPYGQNLLGMAAASIYDYQPDYELGPDGKPKLDAAGKPIPKVDANGNIIPKLDAKGMPIIAGLKQPEPYQGDRQAQFTDLQKQAFAGAKDLGVNESSQAAATGLEGLATKMQDLKYAPTTATNQFTTPGSLGYTAKEAEAAKITQPVDVAAQQVNAANTQAAQAKGIATLAANQMGPAEKVATQSFVKPGAAEAYMSPYVQSVIAKQQREAQRSADIASTRRGAQAASAGAFGGSRQAIENAEAARNLQTQLGDIEAQGLQEAYKQAQAQFNAEQNAGLTAQTANQQAGLTVGAQNLGAKQATQQLQTNADVQVQLANLNAAQQAAVQNAAQQFQASGMNADQAMKAALANQSAAMQTGVQNAQMEQQANLANANAANAAAQFGAGQNLTAAQTAAQYGQAAAQLGEQSKQFGASQGLAALQAAGQTNAALGAQGQNLYNQNVNNLGIQNTMGTQQQQNVQNMLTQQYTDYQNEVNQPYKQLGFMSDIVRGAPTSVQGTTVTTPAPSVLNQVAGAGTALFGLGKARGGAIKQRKVAGLPAILINSMARG